MSGVTCCPAAMIFIPSGFLDTIMNCDRAKYVIDWRKFEHPSFWESRNANVSISSQRSFTLPMFRQFVCVHYLVPHHLRRSSIGSFWSPKTKMSQKEDRWSLKPPRPWQFCAMSGYSLHTNCSFGWGAEWNADSDRERDMESKRCQRGWPIPISDWPRNDDRGRLREISNRKSEHLSHCAHPLPYRKHIQKVNYSWRQLIRLRNKMLKS
jgi:hypothetical protein